MRDIGAPIQGQQVEHTDEVHQYGYAGFCRVTHYTGQVDRDQYKIFIGDTVVFLTTGRFDSSQGVVSGYTTTHAIATDYKNREIKRASHNVRVDRQSK